MFNSMSPGKLIRLVVACLLLAPSMAESMCSGVRFVAQTPPPVFEDDLDLAGLERAVRASLAYLSRSKVRGLSFGDELVSSERVRDGLRLLLRLKRESADRAAFLAAIKREFVFYQASVSGQRARLLVTGYFQPVFAASREKRPPYSYPVYGMPEDLVALVAGRIGRWQGGRFESYPSRAAIEADGLATAPVLAWMRDPVEAFILHVQGSGVLELAEGGELHIGFAGRNGRRYRSIGAYLVQKGVMRLDEVTMPAIIAWLRRHPAEIREVLNHNESYIFFRIGGDGPRGSIGEVLVPGRSVALDSRCFPDGAPLFLAARKPLVGSSGQVLGFAPMRRLVLHQDSGSAIRGPSRLDLFMGRGEAAAAAAGVLRHPGDIFVLLPREREEKVAARTLD